MKTLKYILMFLPVSVLLFSGCYEDKGSYDYENWTDIVSVSGISIPGSSYGRVTILEGEQLVINPVIKYKPGLTDDDFTFHWVMGGDTISSQKDLDWTITPLNIEFTSGEAYFWLAIRNKKTGESWKHHAVDISGSYSYMVNVTINLSSVPMIGVIIYEKSDGTIEWATIKGANKKTPGEFNTILTEMYRTYNPSKPHIQGPFAGATIDPSRLMIYTGDKATSGVSVQTSTGATYPFGNITGTINDLSFMSASPSAGVKAQSGVYNTMQSLLVGEELFVMNFDSYYPYQIINPNTAGTQSRVKNIFDIKPFTRNIPVNLFMTNNGDVYNYTYTVNEGYRRVSILDGQGDNLNVDSIVGVFRQPVDAITPATPVKFFIVAKQGADYIMYSYTIQRVSNAAPVIVYLGETNVSSWAGGIDDDSIWFTNIAPVGWNYAFIAKGKDIWRYSFEDLATPPIKIKSFADDIVQVELASDQTLAGMNETDELYGLVSTYNSVAGTSSVYILDMRSVGMDEFSVIENAVPGKILKYIPYYSN